MNPVKYPKKPTTSDEEEIHLNVRVKNYLFGSFSMDILNQILILTKLIKFG
jgi:hypothetical protein